MDLRTFLIEEFDKRKKIKTQYSLRAFAKDLAMSSTTLSQVINGKRGLSQKKIRELTDKLKIDLPQRGDDYLQLTDTAMKVVFDPTAMPLLSLAETIDNKASTEELSRRLGYSPDMIQQAIDQLVALGILTIQRGRLKTLQRNLTSSMDVPSRILRRFYRKNLELARQSMEKVEVSKRDISSMTLSVSPDSLPKAKAYIQSFRRRFCKKFETSKTSEIYTLAVQLFPNTRTFWRKNEP